ncbi:hypothetical protein CPB85DRAFT_1259945 [Mucidula mucida]|nr:hypothetical protein CPB85DRAFT_1259945 [Mucidula mucida]
MEATLVDLSPPSSPGFKDPLKQAHSISPPFSVALSSNPNATFSALSQISSVDSIEVKTWTPRDLAVDITPLYGDKPPLSIGAHLFKTSGGSSSEIPVPLDTFPSLLQYPGAVWANRISFVHSLYPTRKFDYEHKLSLVRRPSGFGQRLFVTTAPFAYSVHSKKVFTRFFGSSPSLEAKTLTLFIDMAKAFARPAHDPFSTMNTYMNGVLKGFLRSSAIKLDLSLEEIAAIPLDGLSSAIFLWIVECIANAGYELIVTVEDYNLPLINSTPGDIEDIVDAIFFHLVLPIATGLDDQVIAGGMIFGKPVSEEPSWVRESVTAGVLFEGIACDISDESSVHGAFGYTWDEVTALADEVLPTAEMRTQCLGAIQSHCLKYHDPEGKHVEYSVDDVLTSLREQIGLPARYPSPELIDLGSDYEDY